MTTRLEAIRHWQHNHVRIPQGWREVGEAEAIKVGDRYWVSDQWITVPKDDSRVGMRCDPETFSMHITYVSP